jgi:hypothetical protein
MSEEEIERVMARVREAGLLKDEEELVEEEDE